MRVLAEVLARHGNPRTFTSHVEQLEKFAFP